VPLHASIIPRNRPTRPTRGVTQASGRAQS
jgi:hypothetical protein